MCIQISSVKPSNFKRTNQNVPSDTYDSIIYDCLNSEVPK